MSERTGPCAEAIRKIDKVAVGIVLTGEAVSIGSGSANERRSQWRSSRLATAEVAGTSFR
jgi:hypothetical protein